MMDLSLILTILTAALADSINPCAISVLFLTIAFLFNLGKSRAEVLKIGLTYIMGIFMIYLLIGLGILHTLSIFGVPQFMSKIGAVILIVWGAINLLEQIIPNFPIKLQIPTQVKPSLAKLIHQGSIPAALFLGFLVGASEFPCTGGPYLMILGLLHDKATFLQGFFHLIWYNLVFVLPLIIILYFASDPRLNEKVKALRKSHTKSLEIVSSVVLILMGLIILYV